MLAVKPSRSAWNDFTALKAIIVRIAPGIHRAQVTQLFRSFPFGILRGELEWLG